MEGEEKKHEEVKIEEVDEGLMGEEAFKVLLRDERMEDVCEELHDRWAVRIVWRECDAELEDRVCIVAWLPKKTPSLVGHACMGLSSIGARTLMNKEHSVPDEQVVRRWCHVHPEGTMADVHEGSILLGYCCASEGSGRWF